ncbi:MAG: DUF3352 domain-containing protein [Chloroflexaceae bacterium]|nr:DUF3352 domain-containing protein [Chloroflexaceae bacterium]
MASKQNGIFAGIVFTILAILVGTGAFVWWRWRRQELTPLAAAQMIPDDALLSAHLSSDPKHWAKLEEFGTVEARQLIKDNFQALSAQFSEETQLTYAGDIQPWLGNVAIALIPASDSGPSSLLGIVDIKNQLKALEFLKKLQNQGQVQQRDIEDYQGVGITELVDDRGSKFYTAILDNRLIVAGELTAVQGAIGAAKNEPSLAEKNETRELFSPRGTLEQPILQVYLTDYANLVRQTLTENG